MKKVCDRIERRIRSSYHAIRMRAHTDQVIFTIFYSSFIINRLGLFSAVLEGREGRGGLARGKIAAFKGCGR